MMKEEGGGTNGRGVAQTGQSSRGTTLIGGGYSTGGSNDDSNSTRNLIKFGV